MKENGNLQEATYQWLDENPYASTHERNAIKSTLHKTGYNVTDIVSDTGNLEENESIDKKAKGFFDLLVGLSKKYDISKFLPEQLQPVSKKITAYVLSGNYVGYYRLITPFLKRNPALILTIAELLFENIKKSSNELGKKSNKEKETVIDPRVAFLIKHFGKQIISKMKIKK